MKSKKTLGAPDTVNKLLPEGLFAVIIAIALVLNVILYIVTEAFSLYLYSPIVDDLSISGNTDTLFADAIRENRKVKISFCQDEESVKKHSTGNYVYETVNNFKERYPDFIEVEYINILTRRNSKGELVNLSKYQKDMRGNDQNIFKSSVIFESGTNYRVLTDAMTNAGYADFYTLDASMNATSYNGEEVVAGMVSWVLRDEHKTAYFTQFHGEVVDIAFSNLLACAGYYIDVIDLKKNEVPDDAGLVVISNPTADFERALEGSKVRGELDRLETYLEKSGNLFVNLDPYVRELPTLEEFLKDYGIAFSYTTDKDGRRIRNLVKDIQNGIQIDGFTIITEYSSDALAQSINETVKKYSDGDVIVREASALDLSGNARPLLISSKSSSTEAGGEKNDSEGSYCVGAYNNTDSGCVFVSSSVYLAVSDSLVTNGYSNKEMLFALIENLFGGEDMPYGCNAVGYNTGVLENLTMGTAINYTVFFMSIPIVIMLVGVAVTVRRKNR
jgi:hypothetical protein